jgi:Ca2+-binding RTX toxin-like protein
MTIVTVTGASNSTVALSYDTAAAANLATQLAYAISQGVQAGTIKAAQSPGLPPPLPTGTVGLWAQTTPGLTVLPAGYADVSVADSVNGSAVAPGSRVIFGSGDANESILLGKAGVTFVASAGSGTVAGGGGNDRIVIGGSSAGNWNITLGNGDDTVLATGTGTQIVNAGGGHNQIVLGAGPAQVQLGGDDTVSGGSGPATIAGVGDTRALVYGGSGDLTYIGGSEAATIFGGSGSDTFFGGSGPDIFHGGTAGNNLIMGGSGAATLYGGGNGDQLFAGSPTGQVLHAAGGNETLTGGSGNDTFFGSAGNDTVRTGGGTDSFLFVNHQSGGTELIVDFNTATEALTLQGYAAGEAANAFNTAKLVGGSSTVITLSDNTQITLQGITDLKQSNII